jgi:hypothetical protein
MKQTGFAVGLLLVVVGAGVFVVQAISQLGRELASVPFSQREK